MLASEEMRATWRVEEAISDERRRRSADERRRQAAGGEITVADCKRG